MASNSDLREQVANSDQPTIDDDDTDDNSDDGGRRLPGLSRRTLAALGAVVVVVVILWYLRRSPSTDSSNDSDDGESDESATDPARRDVHIEIPANPSEELDKDAAVLEGLRDSGVIGGDD